MGAVWLARHQRLPDKRAAIKVLLGTGLRDEAYLRFAREAEIATRIGHPNIVDVLDLASLPSGEPYIVLEYLQGEDLRNRLRRAGQLSYTEVCAITRQIGSALLAAHGHDVVHRDLKPENVFLVPTDSGGVIREHVKVLDFGISKLRGSQTVQTQEAMLLGTPQYMAPEQASGRNVDVDARTDQFALAVMVYEMLAGAPPWVSDTPLGLLFQVVHAPTPAIGHKLPDVPLYAIAAIEQALQKDANKRFADVGQFVAALSGMALESLDVKKRKTGAENVAAIARSGPVTTSTDRQTHLDSAEADMATLDGSQAATAETYAGDALPTAQTKARPDVLPAPAALPASPAPAALPASPAPPAAMVTAVGGDAQPTREFAKPAPSVAAAPVAASAPEVRVPELAAAPPSKPPLALILWGIALVGLAIVGAVLATRSAPIASPVPKTAPAVPAAPAALPATTSAAAVPAVGVPSAVVPIAAPQTPVPVVAPAPVRPEPPAPAALPAKLEPHLAVAATKPTVAIAEERPVPKDGLPAEVLEAEAALRAEKLAEAERLAVHSLTTQATSRAFEILTRVHCKRGDLGGAKTWFGQIKGAGKGSVKKACAIDGVAL